MLFTWFVRKNIHWSTKKIFIVSISLVLVVVLLAEFYLRDKYNNYESKSYQYTIDHFDPFLQLKLADNYTTNINSYGFRGEEINKDKPKGTFRIFILGGSTVLSRGTAYEKTSARVLEKLLSKNYPNKKIEVINAGVDGYTTEHSLIQYLFKIKDFNPDMIIMWHGINDWYYSCSPPERAYEQYKSDYSHYLGADAAMVFNYFKPQPLVSIKMISYDFFIKFMQDNWYSDLYQMVQKRYPSSGFYSDNNKSNQYDMKKYPSLTSYERNLETFINITKKDNVQFILGNQPNLYANNLDEKTKSKIFFPALQCTVNGKYPSLSSMTKAMDTYNNAAMKIAEKNETPFVNLNVEMPKTLEYFTDDVHYTDKGNAKVGEIIFRFIMTNNMLQ
jgi:lysophospholipase L1-like esterase